jgi:hypothetical protein
MAANAGELKAKLGLDKSQFDAALQAAPGQARSAGAAIATSLGQAAQAGQTMGRDVSGGAREAARGLGELAAEGQRANSILTGVISGITSSLTNTATNMVSGAVSGIKNFVAESVLLAAQNEQTAISFEVLTGSAETAKTLMEEIRVFAEATPYGSAEIANAGKQLLAFGVGAKDVVPTLRRLGDVSSALNIPLGEMAYLFGTTRVQGRLFTQDLNQFTSRGIPLIAELAKQFGVAESEVKNLVESGAVGFADVEKAIASLTSEGGRFFGMMDRQSQSALGLWSTLEDTIDGLKRSLGEGLIKDDGGKQLLKDLIEEAEKLKPIFADAGRALAGALEAALPAIRELLKTATAILDLASGQVEKKKLANATPAEIADKVAATGTDGTTQDAIKTADAVARAAGSAREGIEGVIAAGVGQGMDGDLIKRLSELRAKLVKADFVKQELANFESLQRNGQEVDRARVAELAKQAAELSKAVTQAQGELKTIDSDPASATNSFSDFSQEAWDKMRASAASGAQGAGRALDEVRDILFESRAKKTSRTTKSAAMAEDHDAEHVAGNAAPVKADAKAQKEADRAAKDAQKLADDRLAMEAELEAATLRLKGDTLAAELRMFDEQTRQKLARIEDAADKELATKLRLAERELMIHQDAERKKREADRQNRSPRIGRRSFDGDGGEAVDGPDAETIDELKARMNAARRRGDNTAYSQTQLEMRQRKGFVLTPEQIARKERLDAMIDGRRSEEPSNADRPDFAGLTPPGFRRRRDGSPNDSVERSSGVNVNVQGATPEQIEEIVTRAVETAVGGQFRAATNSARTAAAVSAAKGAM